MTTPVAVLPAPVWPLLFEHLALTAVLLLISTGGPLFPTKRVPTRLPMIEEVAPVIFFTKRVPLIVLFQIHTSLDLLRSLPRRRRLRREPRHTHLI